MVAQLFEAGEGRPPLVLLSWGFDLSTFTKLADGEYAVRLTQGLSLTLDETDPRLARFSFVAAAQGIALPNYVTAFPVPDPAAPPPVVGPAGSLAFGWVGIRVTDIDQVLQDAGGVINLEVRRVPSQRGR